MNNETKGEATPNYTPGPWEWLEDDRYVREAASGIAVARVEEDDGHPEPGCRKPLPRDENAYLIAKAPELLSENERLKEVNRDLLEACEEALEELKRLRTAALGGGGNMPIYSTKKKLDAAIAKAREVKGDK